VVGRSFASIPLVVALARLVTPADVELVAGHVR
jgi:hypothetical protein